MVVHFVLFHLNYWLQAISKLRTNAPLALNIVHMHAYRALTTCKLSFQHENQHWCDLCNKKLFSFLSIDNGHNSNPIKTFGLKHHYDDWSIDSFREYRNNSMVMLNRWNIRRLAPESCARFCWIMLRMYILNNGNAFGTTSWECKRIEKPLCGNIPDFSKMKFRSHKFNISVLWWRKCCLHVCQCFIFNDSFIHTCTLRVWMSQIM